MVQFIIWKWESGRKIIDVSVSSRLLAFSTPSISKLSQPECRSYCCNLLPAGNYLSIKYMRHFKRKETTKFFFHSFTLIS